MATQFFSTVVTTAGTPQRIIASTTPAQSAITGGLGGVIAPRGSCVVLQADAANTAAKSIFVGGPSMSVSAKTGIGFALTPGDRVVLRSEGQIDLGGFWIDTDGTSATEKLYVTVIG